MNKINLFERVLFEAGNGASAAVRDYLKSLDDINDASFEDFCSKGLNTVKNSRNGDPYFYKKNFNAYVKTQKAMLAKSSASTTTNKPSTPSKPTSTSTKTSKKREPITIDNIFSWTREKDPIEENHDEDISVFRGVIDRLKSDIDEYHTYDTREEIVKSIEKNFFDEVKYWSQSALDFWFKGGYYSWLLKHGIDLTAYIRQYLYGSDYEPATLVLTKNGFKKK